MTDKSKPSSHSISQLFIAILPPGLLDRFLLQLNLSSRLCQLFTFLKVFTAPCVLSTIPKAIPGNLSPKCKRKVTSVYLSGHSYTSHLTSVPVIARHVCCSFSKTTLKVTSCLFYFSSFFLPLAFGHLNFSSH